jgi:hypothetical protein
MSENMGKAEITIKAMVKKGTMANKVVNVRLEETRVMSKVKARWTKKHANRQKRLRLMVSKGSFLSIQLSSLKV